eukprot:COSAG02_NODE_3282_length_7020_cov_13.269614_3_plen_178_part_00
MHSVAPSSDRLTGFRNCLIPQWVLSTPTGDRLNTQHQSAQNPIQNQCHSPYMNTRLNTQHQSAQNPIQNQTHSPYMNTRLNTQHQSAQNPIQNQCHSPYMNTRLSRIGSDRTERFLRTTAQLTVTSGRPVSGPIQLSATSGRPVASPIQLAGQGRLFQVKTRGGEARGSSRTRSPQR